MSAARPLTIGTAGHVDHGKTTLVRTLTGRDTDRLAEERRRGLSIELGYAPLRLPSGREVSLIDVPGHGRFVRTMVAGATGIDAYVLCVAADDGFMPQTREHLAVLRALGIGVGVVAITKTDLAAPDTAANEAAVELPGVEVVSVDAMAGEGLHRLLAALERVIADLGHHPTRTGPARLHVDRSFAIHGIGTVVTGTLWSGAFTEGETLLVLPGKRRVRVRSIQVHDQPVDRVAAGQRVALALTGASRSELKRGDVLCNRDTDLRASYRLDVVVRLEHGVRPLQPGARVHVHHGTRETPARVVPLDSDILAPGRGSLCQLRAERPLVAAARDALVVRQIAPPDTIGGGRVVDPAPPRHGRSDHAIERPRDSELASIPVDDRPVGARPSGPSAPGAVLGGRALRLAALLEEAGERPPADGELEIAAGLNPAAARQAWRELEHSGLAIRTGANLHFHPGALERLAAVIIDICRRDGVATVAGVRDELGTSRRYAQALLQHLDAARLTVRQGDVHVLRQRRRPVP